MRNQTFINSVFILLLGSIIAKILGAIYRIPLTWILGAEGLGIYQLVFPIFSLMLVLSSTGMPTAISKLVAHKNNYEAKLILKISIIVLLIIGIIFSSILFICSNYIATMQGNSVASLPYKFIAPAIIFISVLSAFRGYFQGRVNMVPTSVGNIIEQLFKLVLGLAFGYVLMVKGVEYGVCGALLGVTLSEVVVVGYMFIYYIINNKEECCEKTVSIKIKYLIKELIAISFPIVLANIVIPFSLFIDSILVVNLLTFSGFSVEVSTILWGIDSGVVTSLINLPIVFTLAIATTLVPMLIKDKNEQSDNIKNSFAMSLYISIPCSIIMLIIPNDIITLLYGNSLSYNEFSIAKNLLMFSCMIIPITSILQTQNAILQGLNHSKIPLINMLISFIIKTILLIILVPIPIINIYGVVIAKYVFFISSITLNCTYIAKYNLYKQKMIKYFLIPILSSLTMLLSILVFKRMNLNISIFLTLLFEIIIGFIFFIISILCLSDKLYVKIRQYVKK